MSAPASRVRTPLHTGRWWLASLLLLAACNGTPDPSGAAPTELAATVAPAEVTVPRGTQREAQLRASRVLANDERVTVTPGRLPRGVAVAAPDLAPGGRTAPVTVTIAGDAALGRHAVELTLAGALDASVRFDVTVTAPVTLEAVAIDGLGGSRQVRQGTGRLQLEITGSNLDVVTGARLGDLEADLPDERSDAVLRLELTVPHGTPLGMRTLELDTPAGTVTSAEALDVTPVTAGPDGSDDGGRGTPDAPFRTLTRALEHAGSGDTVLLLDGRYDAAHGEAWPSWADQNVPHVDGTNVPDGVTIRGQSADGVTLDGSQSQEAVAFSAKGSLVIENVTVRGFGLGVHVDDGTALVDGVRFLDSLHGLQVAGSATATVRNVTSFETRTVMVARDDGVLEVEGADLEDAFVAVGAAERGELALRDVTITGFLYGVALLDDAVADLADVDLRQREGHGGFTVGVYAQHRSTLRVERGSFAGAYAGLLLSGGDARVRESTLSENHYGVAIGMSSDGRRIDFGSLRDPGGNTFRGHTAYAILDTRPAASSDVVTFSATSFDGVVPDARVHRGETTQPGFLEIQGADNVIQFF